MQLNEILLLKFPEADFLKDIILRDEGKGIYIYEWNLERPMPTSDELAAWDAEFDLAHRRQQAVLSRVYPPIKDQLDMLYQDMKEGTSKWVKSIDKIKSDHPKPTK